MKYAIALLLAVSLNAFAAEDPNYDAARKECDKQGEAAGNKAVQEAVLQHPGDATEVKRKAKLVQVIRCMRLAGYASGPIRAK